ncbi:hypothetical protein P280DRAFT_520000 [Massarina eburnea CBS 473.64]|uniref:Uncharacterized protein n=1 Tax=Massarina eburnea CBS 473.64 TaxID=1395130 RepID=A0A6A6RU83_9PLEO|nr:hypothetical protein P280DRAFT_520000 [Massarina eburnea CBS 473.64]
MLTVHVFLAALFVANGAYAKTPKVYIQKYGGDCDEEPLGSLVKLKEDKCVPIVAENFKITPYPRREELDCHVDVYDTNNCWKKTGAVDSIVLPEGYGKCQDGPAEYPYSGSAKLVCKPKEVRRATPAPVSRKDYNHVRVQFKHPFKNAEVCWTCWTDHAAKFDDFECESLTSAPESGCKKLSLPTVVSTSTVEVLTSISTRTSTATISTSTSTVTAFKTTSVLFSPNHPSASPGKAELKEREATDYLVQNPWTNDIYCAKAKWEDEKKGIVKIKSHKDKGKVDTCSPGNKLYEDAPVVWEEHERRKSVINVSTVFLAGTTTTVTEHVTVFPNIQPTSAMRDL